MAIIKIDTSTAEGRDTIMELSAKIEKEKKALKSINNARVNLCVRHAGNLVKGLQKKYEAKGITFEQLNETVSFTDQHGQTCTAHIVITTGDQSSAVVANVPAAASKTPFSDVEEAIFAHIATLDQKKPLNKAEFTAILTQVEGYQEHMWDDLKAKLKKDPKGKGRGSRFFPHVEG